MPSSIAISMPAKVRYGLHAPSGRSVFDPLRRRARPRDRDADRRRAVPLAVREVDRRVEAGHEPLVAVRRRIGERAQCRGVLEQAADRVLGGIGQSRISQAPGRSRSGEQVGAILPQRHVDVHRRAVVVEQRLGHERRRLAVPPGDVLHHVLVLEHVVRRATSDRRSGCRPRPARPLLPRDGGRRRSCRTRSGRASSPSADRASRRTAGTGK